MDTDVKVAGIQMAPRIADKAHNLAYCLDSIRTAAREGTRLVVFPECALSGYAFSSREEALPVAESIPGPSTEAIAAACSELGVYVVLSYNSTDPETTVTLHGQDITEQKRQAIDNITRAGLKMTLLHVMVQGFNQAALGPILDLMNRRDNILSLTIQTMTYTGQQLHHGLRVAAKAGERLVIKVTKQ